MLYEGLQLGRYRLVRIIGRGGTGEVYLAEDQRIKRQVALKLVQSESLNGDSAKDAAHLFQREAQTIALLSHPNILPLFDFGEEIIDNSTFIYLITPYCAEGSLSAWLHRHSATLIFPPHEVINIVQQAADALEYAHDQQIVHRDVKPSNFLVRSRKDAPDRPHLLLADFGIARFTQASVNTSRTIRGTPKYMGPEQWSGNFVPATDQYALAVMAYELLAGRPPFQGTQEQVMYHHLMTPPQPPSAFNPRITPIIDAILLRALSKQPEGRFPSITEFARAFQQAAQVLPQPSMTPVISASSAVPDLTSPSNSPVLVSSSPFAGFTPHISTPEISQNNDIHAMLTISSKEAISGVNRTITLPDRHHIKVAVPPGVRDGQVIRLDSQFEPTTPNTAKGNLIVTIAVTPGAEPAIGKDTSIKTDSAVIEAIPGLPAPRFNLRPFIIFGLVLLVLGAGIAGFSILGLNRGSPDATNAPSGAGSTTANTLQGASSAATATAVAQATSTSQLNATATASAILNTYDGSLKTLALNDSLASNGNSRWDVTNGRCAFTGGGYQAISQAQDSAPQVCFARGTNYGDFTFEVQMKILKGNSGGILFRSTGSSAYYFRISQDGTYALFLCAANGTACHNILPNSISSAITPGRNQSNLIAVVAKGSRIELYVNNERIDGVNDTVSSHGQIGVVADTGSQIVFNNAKVWTS